MNANDFTYDNKKLSDYGFIVCDFNGGDGVTEINSGALITFNTSKKSYGKKYHLINTEYDSCVSATFDICKNPETNDDMMISELEYRKIARWLNRKEFIPFNFISHSANEEETIYFNASFNLSKLYIRHQFCGIRCNMVTNAPFGYGKKKTFIHTFSGNDSFVLKDSSDEIGYIYPDITITCLEAGNLAITNSLTGSNMIIKNVSVDEQIEIKGEPQIINTSKVSHNIVNDFNFRFLTVGNTAATRNNTISSNLSCNITISYSPIIKDFY